MRVNHLKIRNLRNISEADIDFSPTLNYFQGENGAGKTTVLEALYLLARSKSFSKANHQTLIQNGADRLSIFMSGNKTQGDPLRIGLTKDKKNTSIKLNSEPIRKLSELARNLPVSLITPQTHKILEDGPEFRRRLLNWGVFHVEHEFELLTSNYNRVIQQRNQAMKEDSRNASIWDKQLVQYASDILEYHLKYLQGWSKYMEMLNRTALGNIQITIDYYQGWDRGLSLQEVLNQKFELDKRRGFTSVGPHRSDLIFKVDGLPIKGYLSRGQQKKVIIFLKISQALYMYSKQGDLPVLLIDDFQSELDKKSQHDILTVLQTHRIQAIITGIQNLQTGHEEDVDREASVFHVEHGKIRKHET